MKYLPFVLLFFPLTATAGGYKYINKDDTSGINFNFDRIKHEDLNSVHKASSETITGLKTFTHGIRFSDGTISTTASSGSGSGDMLLNTTQVVTATKTFTGGFAVTGVDSIFTSSQLRMTDGYGMYWGNTALYGYDAGDYFRFDAGGNEATRITSTGLAISRGSPIATTDIDTALEVWSDGVFSRPGINIVTANSNHTEAPVIILENQQPPSAIGSNGTAIAFYSTGTQQGVIGFSWTDATTTTAKMQIYLQSGGNSIPVMKMLGAGATGYAYTLFGAPHIHTPGATLHVASDSGDVDSGIRIERGAATARYNEFIDSSGDFNIRETDITTFPLKIQKTSGKVTTSNTLTANFGVSSSTGVFTGAVSASTFSATLFRGSTVQFVNNGGAAEAQMQWIIPALSPNLYGFGWSSAHSNVGYYGAGTSVAVFRDNIRAVQSSAANAVAFALASQNTGLYGDSSTWGISINAKRTIDADASKITISSHTEFAGPAPTISACGAVPNGSVVGNDKAGIITVGGGVVTACTLTFISSWSNIAICNLTDDNSAISVAVTTSSVSAITLGFGASLGGGKVYYRCQSYN